ncbi:MAG: DMT family transporter [Porphyrobacter sp.]|nr:DMT family transporter [Porphyrobacter sp.]
MPATPGPSSAASIRLLPLGALLLGNVALALGPWLVRLAQTGPVSAGFWRVFLALPMLAMLARANGQRLGGFGTRTLAAVLLGGVFFALDLASWHVGIGMTRLANATLFGNSGSLVLMLWGFIVWRRLPQGREWLAIAAAMGGAGVLLGRSFEMSPASFAGDLYSLAAGLLYAGYLVLMQDARQRLGGWALLTWSCAASAPVLLVLALALGEPVWPGSGLDGWGPVIALAISSQLLGQGLLVYALRHFAPLTIGIALLTQPAVAALSGWLAFGERLGPADLAGMALLAAALVLARAAPPVVQPPRSTG